jgi:hypothetical protein
MNKIIVPLQIDEYTWDVFYESANGVNCQIDEKVWMKYKRAKKAFDKALKAMREEYDKGM